MNCFASAGYWRAAQRLSSCTGQQNRYFTMTKDSSGTLVPLSILCHAPSVPSSSGSPNLISKWLQIFGQVHSPVGCRNEAAKGLGSFVGRSGQTQLSKSQLLETNNLGEITNFIANSWWNSVSIFLNDHRHFSMLALESGNVFYKWDILGQCQQACKPELLQQNWNEILVSTTWSPRLGVPWNFPKATYMRQTGSRNH